MMKKSGETILPLYHFFERLRQNDFPLGIGEYEKLLVAIKKLYGFVPGDYQTLITILNDQTSLAKEKGLIPRDQLLNLCKLLWLKPNQSVQLFEELYEETYFLDFKTPDTAAAKPEQPTTAADTGNTPSRDSKIQTPENDLPESTFESGEPAEATAVNPEDDLNPQLISVRLGYSEYNPGNKLLIRQNKTIETEKSKFLFTKYYFPVDRRKIIQNLRLFPSYRSAYTSNEIDIELTIKKTIEKGFFNEVAFKKHKLSSASLLLLIDHHDSMVAFDQFADNLKIALEKILIPKGANSDLVKTFYFYNSSASYFFSNKAHTSSESVDKIVNRLKGKGANVIIVSDAGSAKGDFNSNTVKSAGALLAKLHQHTNKIAWLNPMPRERWTDTAAETISESVAMFEATENGIKNAVALLKGTSSKLVKFI